MPSHVFYLHGFASGTKSTKAEWLAGRLAPHGIPLYVPDFNLPDFATLTVTRMIADVERALTSLDQYAVALIGSSLGALVAYHTAVRNARVDRLILLAPALDFVPSLRRGPGAEKVEQWRTDGSLEVFHHGYREIRRVSYALLEDAEQYDPFSTTLDRPILIVQGRRDDAVSPETVERFASTRPHVELHMLEDNHQLISSLEYIWQHTARFLGLPPR